VTSSYFNTRRAPTDLASGRVLAPGEQVTDTDLVLGRDDDDRVTHDQHLVDGGALGLVEALEVPVLDSEDRPLLAGEALEQRARELNIEGRSQMSADDLRAAVAEAEADTAADDDGEV
jgi:hypothetical protein